MEKKKLSLEDFGWTADFSKFRQKVESVFGPLEKLAEAAPDIYAHLVLSHGFMEYAIMKDLYAKIEEQIADTENKYNITIDKYHTLINELEIIQRKEHTEIYNSKLKEEYMKWARENNLPENLLELGWKEYLED